MGLNEFKEFVIKSAQKYIFEDEELDETKKILKQPEPPKLTKPDFMKRDVNKLPKEPKAPKTPEVKTIATPKAPSVNEEVCSPDKIKILAEEMKKINKKIDLRNPLISPELFDIVAEDRKPTEDVIKEDSTERWKNLYNYEIPDDNLR